MLLCIAYETNINFNYRENFKSLYNLKKNKFEYDLKWNKVVLKQIKQHSLSKLNFKANKPKDEASKFAYQ
jgi:hypothetical protein